MGTLHHKNVGRDLFLEATAEFRWVHRTCTNPFGFAALFCISLISQGVVKKTLDTIHRLFYGATFKKSIPTIIGGEESARATQRVVIFGKSLNKLFAGFCSCEMKTGD